MAGPNYRIYPLGDTAITVEFGRVISEDLNRRAIALCRYFDDHPFPGLIESVPAYASVTVFYDLSEVRREFPSFVSASAAVSSFIEAALAAVEVTNDERSQVFEIPVAFDAESGPDLEAVAEIHEITVDEVISIFLSRTYRVFMIGFLPGFSYMGEVDDRIATARRATPRTSVPKGSVGIAGKQTGIYSLGSPGGWQLIGRTPTELFRPNDKRPSLLTAGDSVRFVRI